MCAFVAAHFLFFNKTDFRIVEKWETDAQEQRQKFVEPQYTKPNAFIFNIELNFYVDAWFCDFKLEITTFCLLSCLICIYVCGFVNPWIGVSLRFWKRFDLRLVVQVYIATSKKCTKAALHFDVRFCLIPSLSPILPLLKKFGL